MVSSSTPGSDNLKRESSHPSPKNGIGNLFPFLMPLWVALLYLIYPTDNQLNRATNERQFKGSVQERSRFTALINKLGWRSSNYGFICWSEWCLPGSPCKGFGKLVYQSFLLLALWYVHLRPLDRFPSGVHCPPTYLTVWLKHPWFHQEVRNYFFSPDWALPPSEILCSFSFWLP